MEDGESVPVPLAVRTSDLKVRSLSAIVMLALAGTALWYHAGTWQLFVVVVASVCFAEFCRLLWLGFPSAWQRAVGLALGAPFIFLAASRLIALRQPFIRADGISDVVTNDLTLSAAFGFYSVVSVLGVVVATDVGAYFVGRTFGGPKIAPAISPSKTWSGLCGGMLAAAIWGVVATFMLADVFDWKQVFTVAQLSSAAASGAILAVVAQSGDFLESWLKRKAGVKDSSNLIPAHGGVFDRVDGVLPVVIVAGLLPFGPFP